MESYFLVSFLNDALGSCCYTCRGLDLHKAWFLLNVVIFFLQECSPTSTLSFSNLPPGRESSSKPQSWLVWHGCWLYMTVLHTGRVLAERALACSRTAKGNHRVHQPLSTPTICWHTETLFNPMRRDWRNDSGKSLTQTRATTSKFSIHHTLGWVELRRFSFCD